MALPFTDPAGELGAVREVGALQAVRTRGRAGRGLCAAVALVGVLAACVPPEPPTADVPFDGPGIGATSFRPDEMGRYVSTVDRFSGVPEVPIPTVKQFGTNVATMLNGYMVTMFAPDSGGGPGGFLVYELSDPRKPRLVRRVYDPNGTTAKFREPHALPAARIGGRQLLAIATTEGIELWDFTDARNPVPFSRLRLPGVRGGDYFDVSWQLSWQAPHLYVGASNLGLFIVDTSDPSAPRLADRGQGRPNPVPPSELGGFRVGPVFAFGNQLVLSSMDNSDGFANLDLSDPRNPVLVARSGATNNFYASCFDGETVHLTARGTNQLTAYRVAAPASSGQGAIERAGSVPVEQSLYCAHKDELVISGNQRTVSFVDATDLAAMRVVGEGTQDLFDPDLGQVTPIGNVVFVGNDHGTGSGFMPISAEPDRRGPEVVTTAPRDGETGVGTGASIAISFGDSIDLRSVDSSSISVAPVGREPIDVVPSAWLGMVGLTPVEPLEADTTYEVRVAPGGVKDLAGNPVVSTTVVRFSTGSALSAAPTLDAQPDRARVGTSVTLRVDGAAGPYTWNLGDGSPTVTTAEPELVHTYPSHGHRQVTVRAGSSDPVFASASVTTTRVPRWAADPVASSPIAVAGGSAFVANRDSRTVSAVSTDSGALRWEVELGAEPSTVTIDGHGRVWVTLQGDDQVAVVSPEGELLRRVQLRYGAAPYGAAAVPGRDLVAVAGEGDGVLRLLDAGGSSTLGDVIDEVPVGTGARGVGTDGDGDGLWVTLFRTPTDAARSSEAGPAVVQRIGLDADRSLTQPVRIGLPVDRITADGEGQARGVANYLEQVVVGPDGAEAWIPSKKDNVVAGRFRDGTDLTPETTVRSLVTRLDLVGPNAPGGVSGAEVAGAIDINDRSAARAVAFTPDGDFAFVAHMESNEVTVVDAYSGAPVGALPEMGRTPTGLAMDPATGNLLVSHLLDRSVSVYDVAGYLGGSGFVAPRVATTDVVADELLGAQELRGKQVFYDASDPRMTSNRYMSCASCHQEGDSDAQTWDFTQRGEGLRQTTTLLGRSGTAHGRLHWSANFDEVQDFENDIRNHFGGRGFMTDGAFAASRDPLGAPKAGRSADLDALSAYVSSLSTEPRSPYRTAQGVPDAAALRGREVFDDLGCASCHSGTTFTDGRRHDVGTVDASSGRLAGQRSGAVDTPGLRGLWATAPYFHNGSAADLSSVFARGHGGGSATPAQVSDLVRFLQSLDGSGDL